MVMHMAHYVRSSGEDWQVPTVHVGPRGTTTAAFFWRLADASAGEFYVVGGR